MVTIPEGVSERDISDPDNMTNMTCMSYVEKRLAQQQAKINKNAEEGIRMSPEDREKLLNLTKQKMVRYFSFFITWQNFPLYFLNDSMNK